MNYKLTVNEGFSAGTEEKQTSDGITEIKISAVSDVPKKLELKLEWETENIGAHMTWSPLRYDDKAVRPWWSDLAWHESNAMMSAPIVCDVAYDDTNRITVACSDAQNRVRICSGVVEETARLVHKVLINVDCSVKSYEAIVRIDVRELPFYRCVEDTARWWESFKGYQAAAAPSAAREPVYSTWYSFHRSVDTAEIIKQCRYFASLGCKTVIVDDGWQTKSVENGYSYCGDWEPHPAKVDDMKRFVDEVHGVGMKFLLWFSVPFVGVNSKAYERFKDKMLCKSHMANTWIIDPRYPEVREYLINIYKKALTEWGLDGFKLDFIDSFSQTRNPDDVMGTVKDGMDFVSVYDAVDRLMKDVLGQLREIKSDVMIEFRQGYMGPLMRTFGNMLRVADCPCDSLSNRIGSLALRMTGGGTAVHSDMVMWNYTEPAETAAFQLTNTLFAVPQISVLYEKLPQEHIEMIRSYLGFWKKYRDVLLDGNMMYKGYAANYSFVAATLKNVTVGAVYSGKIAYVEASENEFAIVNASMDTELYIESKRGAEYTFAVTDCFGNKVHGGSVRLGALPAKISVPVNGRIILKAAEK